MPYEIKQSRSDANKKGKKINAGSEKVKSSFRGEFKDVH
jgi:hypothetical protein